MLITVIVLAVSGAKASGPSEDRWFEVSRCINTNAQYHTAGHSRPARVYFEVVECEKNEEGKLEAAISRKTFFRRDTDFLTGDSNKYRTDCRVAQHEETQRLTQSHHSQMPFGTCLSLGAKKKSWMNEWIKGISSFLE